VNSEPPLLEIRSLSKNFGGAAPLFDRLSSARPRVLQAVRDVSLNLAAGETLGLVGESGCGKSTLARCIAGLYQPTAGEILYHGHPLHGKSGDRRTASRRVQMIFQDPYASLNPRLSIESTLAEVLIVHRLARSRGEIRDRVDQLLSTVGLSPKLKQQLPHAFSGGQRQRISVARALAVEPEIIIADEPISALDVSIQAQIVNLFIELRERYGLAYIFIAHDLNVVRHISHRVAVMYLGQIAELADSRDLFSNPGHPYTRSLLSAIPKPDPEQRTRAVSLEGDLPDPYAPPLGCSFSTRCPLVVEKCRALEPSLDQYSRDHYVRCHRAFDVGFDPAQARRQ
jgi:oligopeptide/dipeptide ABC transporter ATP-binding protein